GVPFVLTPFLHTGDPADPYNRTRRTFTLPALLDIARSAERLFVQTEGERQAFLHHRIAADRLVLQGLGVAPDESTGGDRQRARAAWGFDPGTVVVGHLANLSLEKGSLDLLAATEMAWKRGARFGLVLAGQETSEFRQFRDLGRPWNGWPPAWVRSL